MKIIIRSASEADADRITDIFNQAIPAGDAEWTETLHTVEERREWMRSRFDSGRPVLVAVAEGTDGVDDVIGVASYGDFRESTCREGFRFVCEHSVYVDDRARGSGAATLLMDELESAARANGLKRMVATIDALNERSIAFHRRRGFVEVGRMPDIGFTFDTWRTMVLLQLDLAQSNSG
ncbi:GNAT family N-acetyltransferase [Ilumatobacter nonamiensis]|uniref:GNAT family N-acetyltransferase n=1 Tax=Ilumatobacter nonamiensis TaxID=467093 RepID=UPI00034C7594|nr:GNAT family N-acetyltransferase [Ilumatobacter nonamiensis]